MNRRALSAPSALLLASGLAFGLVLHPSPAAAREKPTGPDGPAAAFALVGALNTCSAVSIVGNGVTLGMKKPNRAWMYSGFICGFLNVVSGPIVLVYGRDPSPTFGYAMGSTHFVLGAANLGVAIANAVLWHKQRVAAESGALPPVALLPYVGRDSSGGDVLGLSASGAF